MKERNLSARDIREFVATIESDPTSVERYVGAKPLRDADGNIVIVAADSLRERLILTPYALQTGDGRQSEPLSETASRVLRPLFVRA